MKNGLFIVFEGIDGCGKTTQAKALQKRLCSNGLLSVFTREPYKEGEICSDIRSLLMKDYNGKMSPLAELFMFEATRTQHIKDVILPALNEGKIVICDRFTDSTIAYQGYGRELGYKTVKMANDIAVGNIKPDVTFWIDVPVEIAMKRSHQVDVNIRDNETKEFYENCIAYFDKKSKESNKFIRINGNQNIDDVFNEILSHLSI